MRSWVLGVLLWACGAACWALSPAQQLAIASGDSEARLAALQQAVAAGEPGTAAYLQALLDGRVRLVGRAGAGAGVSEARRPTPRSRC